MQKYSTEICNVKNCSNKFHKILLCKKHYDRYIIDEKINLIQTNVFNYSIGKKTFSDYLKLFFYFLFHHTFNIRVYYIEHFPLESIFLYHYRKKNIKNNEHYNIIEFIEDFDYEQNYKIRNLKSLFKTKDSNKRLLEFAKSKMEDWNTLMFIVFFIVFIISLFSIKLFTKIEIHYYDIFAKFALSFLMSIPIVYLGVKFINSSKVIINIAGNDKLYESKSDNQKFLEDSQSIINRIDRNIENKFSFFGYLFAMFTFILNVIIKDLSGVGYLAISISLYLSFLVFIQLAILFSVLWQNLFIVPIIRRFHNSLFKMDIYSLDKDIGIKDLKQFIRNLLLYNIIVLITYFSISREFVNNYTVIFFVISYLIGWNISSFIFIYKIYNNLQKQFKEKITDEKAALNINKSLGKFEKYRFLEDLNLDLFIRWKSITKPIFLLIPLALKTLFEKYGPNIIEFIKSYIR